MTSIIPYTLTSSGEWTLSDEFVEGLFCKMESEGKADTVFMAGDIKTPEEFREAMQGGRNWLYLVVKNKALCGFLWLNRLESKMARIHFCGFKSLPLSDMIDAAQEATDQLLYMRDDDGFLLDVLVGYTPEINKAAAMLSRGAGFKVSGVIPDAAYNASTGKSEGVVVLYKNRTTTSEYK